MKSFFASKPVYVTLRLILGLLFMYAGIMKLTNPGGFAVTINLYGLVTWRLANILAYAIPTIEIITGLGLLLDIKGALLIIVAQLLGFMIILLYALHLGLDADCGCFGRPRATDNNPTGPLGAFIRDGGMLITCVVLYWQRRTAGYHPRPISRLLSKNA